MSKHDADPGQLTLFITPEAPEPFNIDERIVAIKAATDLRPYTDQSHSRVSQAQAELGGQITDSEANSVDQNTISVTGRTAASKRGKKRAEPFVPPHPIPLTDEMRETARRGAAMARRVLDEESGNRDIDLPTAGEMYALAIRQAHQAKRDRRHAV